MTRREIVALSACIVIIGWLARDALANGQDKCTGAINLAGQLVCSSNQCPGTCANTGWSAATGGADEWKWNGNTWVFVKTLGHNEGHVQSCACDGLTSTCCRTVLIQDEQGGIHYGSYGGCVDDCTPPMHDPCHLVGNPNLQSVEAQCNP
jgi:hypothetical protein